MQDGSTKASKPIEPVKLEGDVGFKSKHAYRILVYASVCGEFIESVWNARDADAPEVIQDESGGVELKLMAGCGPLPVTSHVPNLGDRVFIEMTKGLSAAYAAQHVASVWESNDELRSKYNTQAEASDALSDVWDAAAQGTALVEVSRQTQRHFYESYIAKDLE